MTAAIVVWAAAAGSAAWVWLTGGMWWTLAAFWAWGLILQAPGVMVGGLFTAVGWNELLKARRFAVSRDRDEQAALLFLVRLDQLLRVRGTLAGALQDMGYRSPLGGSAAGEKVLAQVADGYQVSALSLVSRVARVVQRHGGSLSPLLAWAIDAVHGAQSRRHGRQLEEAAQRSTVVVLAFAPWAIVGIFRMVVPTFYQVLSTSSLGAGTLAGIGAATAVVLIILARHENREAMLR